MKKSSKIVKKSLAVLNKHRYISLASAIALMTTAGTVIFLCTSSTSKHNSPLTSKSTPATTNQQTVVENTDTKTATSPDPNKPADPKVATTPTAQATSTTTKPNTSTAQKTLIISPSSLTVKRGDAPSVSISTSDGKAINMPMFSTSSGGKFIFNFAAGPAKSSWNGPIMILSGANVGSYTLGVLGQDNNAASYTGTITINVVEPTMNISVESLGYDTEDDSVNYLVHVSRQYGHSDAISSVSAYSNTEPGLGCIYGTIDGNTIGISCGHDSGTRPTNGTLTISVTAGITRTTTASYSLPPQP